MTANQRVEPDSLYQPGLKDTGANPRIRSVVLDIRARYGAMRILGIGHGAWSLCRDLYHAGYAGYTVASIEASDSGAAHSAGLAPADHSYPPVTGADPSLMKAAGFDMAISIESSGSGSNPSTLVKLAASNLQPNGVFILSMPYSSHIKSLLITVRERWKLPLSASWDGGYVQRWSKKCLTALLKSHGFTVVEFIGVRDFSLQWEALILVARKTGLSEPVGNKS
ncbi:MAG: methyltransferase domain-containing protein [Candidatus Competibacteraceae bacterium]|nr:methyltransferase domain-containing protein [Candidatus Competibacteraceae bacterium]